MDASKVPPFDVAASYTGSVGTTGAPGTTGSASTPESAAAAPPEPQSTSNIAPILDRADIRPLDLTAALQILMSEVQAALDLPPDAVSTQAPSQAPLQAARVLVEMWLQAMPEEANDAPAWAAAVAGIQSAFQSGMQRALDAIAVWRDVPQAVVDAVGETRALVLALLDDEAANPLWLRPEWLGLAPKMQRFRRRRRSARRRLTDPDYPMVSLDEDSPERWS